MSQWYVDDDGTLDTVVRCEACGEVERFNYANSCEWWPPETDDDPVEDDYAAFVAGCLRDVERDHECEASE